MTKLLKNTASVIAGTAMTIVLAYIAFTDPAQGADTATVQNQVAAAPTTVTLPTIVVHPVPDQSWYYDPYTSGHGPRPSSMHTMKAEHYKVPPGYDANVALHPYTSNFGPCPNGGTGLCSRAASSYYEIWPFNQ
jgi:hypothetical protein